MRYRALVFAIACAVLSAACEKCAPGQVAQGLSRLTIRNTGALVQLINEDTACGFESELAKASAVSEPGENGRGAVTWRIEDCVIDIPWDQPKTAHDCEGKGVGVTGKVTVTATRRITGTLIGDPEEPVVPDGPDAVTVKIERAEVDHFRVDDSGDENVLTWITGTVSATAAPRLARGAGEGFCSAPTPNVKFSNIRYEKARVRVQTESRDFYVDVPSSDLSAVNGRHGMLENALWGTITVWESPQDIPTSDDESALNPDYDPGQFETAYACEEELAKPVDFDCKTDVSEALAQGSAQLTVQMIGMLGLFIDEDTTCGFASPEVKYGPQIAGMLGERGGEALWTISSPCTVTFPDKTEINKDCNGKRTYAQGTVRLTGTKRLRGYVSGDPEEPIVPTSRDPAEVILTAELDGFSLWSDPEEHQLTVESGKLTATIHPRVAKDTSRGACSIKTPASEFVNITWENAKLAVRSGVRTLHADIATSNLTAQNGNKEGRTNYLAGTMVINGVERGIPTEGDPILDPEYDQKVFDASYACKPNIRVPAAEVECNMLQTLGDGAARLIVRSTGTLTSLVNSNKDCGYESRRVLLRPSRVEGDDGQMGLMEWQLRDCHLEGKNQPYETDCLGRKKYMHGNAWYNGKRTVQGLREVIDIFGLINIDSIVPNSRTSVVVLHEGTRLMGFFDQELDPGEMVPKKAIRIHSGTLHASVQPILGERRDEPGRFDVPTKVAHMTNVILRDAPITIIFEGKTFNVHVQDANIEAFNGSWVDRGLTNHIAGTITVDGTPIRLTTADGLDPDFMQADFDARYGCTDNLRSTIPPAP